ncbi:initiation factor 2 [Clostridium polynesiense]|uniref:initiation factor 2 n=1 Tax=Clostridium polynesiense TaxID=1325933 RepID=UPI000590C112|nr:initiation factor 2 [Clostridium polynesiense]
MEKEVVRSLLPESVQSKFDDITLSRVLGANKQIKLMGEMIIAIADDPSNTKDEIVRKTKAVAEFFKSTRGQNSRAIYNALNIYILNIDTLLKLEEEEARKTLKQTILSYEKESEKNTNKLIQYTVSMCENMDTIMIFDYSSTVNQLLKDLKHQLTVYIPESRALNGGKPFVKDALKAGHKVRFIPDTTLMHYLKECQAAFMGAETIYPDGTVFNTIGSDLVAVACKYLNIPFYALTPLIKVDVRPVYGYKRLSPMPYDYSARLAADWDEETKSKIDFSGIKLVSITPDLITAIICEEGIIPAESMFETAIKYNRKLEDQNG